MAGEAKVFACPNCGAQVVIRAQGLTLSVVCSACASIIDATNENHQILSKFEKNANIKPLIALGTRGKLLGDLWEVIGFVIRATGPYNWREYLLYNPYKGYRWLTEYDGHWTYVTMIKERPKCDGGVAVLGPETYRQFQNGEAVVKYVLGEFYWRVKVGEKVAYADYIAPPKILSLEGDKGEIVWSSGLYVEPGDIAAAFKTQGGMPQKIGVGACQPFPSETSFSAMKMLGGVFAGLLLLIHAVTPTAIVWNLVVCEILVLAPLLALWFYRLNFEQQRWGDSSIGDAVSDLLSNITGDDD